MAICLLYKTFSWGIGSDKARLNDTNNLLMPGDACEHMRPRMVWGIGNLNGASILNRRLFVVASLVDREIWFGRLNVGHCVSLHGYLWRSTIDFDAMKPSARHLRPNECVDMRYLLSQLVSPAEGYGECPKCQFTNETFQSGGYINLYCMEQSFFLYRVMLLIHLRRVAPFSTARCINHIILSSYNTRFKDCMVFNDVVVMSNNLAKYNAKYLINIISIIVIHMFW